MYRAAALVSGGPHKFQVTSRPLASIDDVVFFRRPFRRRRRGPTVTLTDSPAVRTARAGTFRRIRARRSKRRPDSEPSEKTSGTTTIIAPVSAQYANTRIQIFRKISSRRARVEHLSQVLWYVIRYEKKEKRNRLKPLGTKLNGNRKQRNITRRSTT